MGTEHSLKMKKILLHPLFLLGLILRLGLIYLVSPIPVTEWYMPFMQASSSFFNLNPWEIWLNQNGSVAAFPYGYVMWAAFLPLTFLCKLFSIPLIYGYGFTLAVADFTLLMLLHHMITSRVRPLLFCYWLSPIVIVASYLLGLNDLIPVTFLVLSIFLIRQSKLMLSGLVCMAAISAKFSMVLALPFFIIYLLHNRALRQLFTQFLRGIVIGSILFGLPFVFSQSGMVMLFSNPEMGKIYRFAIDLSANTKIYLVPLAYLLMLYMAWRVRRINFELFQAMLGMAFLLVVLMTPASPGWFIWAIPFLVIYQTSSDRIGVVLTSSFSLLYVVSSLLVPSNYGATLEQANDWYKKLAPSYTLSLLTDERFTSLLQTVTIAMGIILLARIWRETISRNDYFRLSRKPFVIGVAGDSGAGKDTFANSIRDLFGSHSVTTLSGDDYHLWDRQKPMWQVMTHLNPMANDLELFANDLVALTDGKSISMRHYDHHTGRMGHPTNIKSNDLIIASGLHALYLPILRECYNLSIYLDIDEDLRRYFKIQRDVGERGHSLDEVLASFNQREADSIRFIKSQAAYADLVFSVQPIHPRMLQENEGRHLLRFKLVVRSRHGLSELTLTRILVGICGLHVDMATTNDAAETEIIIEGETSAQDVALAAKMICPRVLEFLDITPQWKDGVLGLMQLITLSHINQALMKRFI